jgi:hypothetical protein
LGSKESAYLFFNNGVIFAPGVFIFSEELTFFLLENSLLTRISLLDNSPSSRAMRREHAQRLLPLAFDLDVYLVHTSTRADWAYLPSPENSLQIGRELQAPALRCWNDRTLRYHLLQIPVIERVSRIHSAQSANVFCAVTFESDHVSIQAVLIGYDH